MTTAAFPLPQHYFEALRRFDRRGAARLVQDYLDGGGHIEGLFVDVLMPAMILTGEEWEAARISVAHEHYISEVTRDLIHQYGHETWTGALSGGPVAVACCAPGERHTLGLLMISDMLRAGGIDVHMLGESAPADSIRDLVTELRADLFCLSVTLEVHLPDAADLIALILRLSPRDGDRRWRPRLRRPGFPGPDHRRGVLRRRCPPGARPRAPVAQGRWSEGLM